ncbi:MAG TPA: hypothetical protein VGR01_07055 [Burkholderiales bacterium]|jgi:hypothetical protein|nr:hypothetical protein [Burkholderiales bacterium]
MTQDLVPGPAVPLEYIGVWKRALLRTPKIEDTTSQVYWMQTHSWHADIRVPANRPACKGKLALDQLSRDELFGLARQQGFVGTTVVEADICRWLRRYDFQPPNGANDIGRMVFETPDRVLEYGLEADYFEIWERWPGSQGGSFARQISQDPLTLSLGTGDFRMIVRPRTARLQTASSMSGLAADTSTSTLRELLDFEINFGRTTSAGAWRIELSTLPWREGEDIL